MGAEALVLLLVGTHRLVPVAIGATHLRVILRVRIVKLTVNGEKVGVETHRENILGREIALAKRQVVDGVQQVGLATAVLPDNAVHILVELELGLLVAFEIGKFDAG